MVITAPVAGSRILISSSVIEMISISTSAAILRILSGLACASCFFTCDSIFFFPSKVQFAFGDSIINVVYCQGII